MQVHARTSLAGVLCGKGGGDRATDQAPETCRPNAAQSVVPGGLGAHTRETASPLPRGGGGPCRKWSRRSASPPIPCPLGIQQRVRRWRVRVVRARGQGEETKRRAAAMMLSRTGWDVTPLPVATRPVRAGGHHGDVPRVRPTGGPHLLLLLLCEACVRFGQREHRLCALHVGAAAPLF